MRTRKTVVGLTAATLLALTGCQGSSGADASDRARSAPRPEASAEPEGSPPLVRRIGAKPVRTSLGGVVSYRVYPGKGLTEALGLRLGDEADAYMEEHMLRADRWSGSHMVKEGELDDLRAKVVPALHQDLVEATHAMSDTISEHGETWAKWPRKVQEEHTERARTVGRMMLNTELVHGGKGDIRYEATERDVFVATKALGWEGKVVGSPVTWLTVETRRGDNSGSGKTFGVWQAWRRMSGEWRIFEAGWHER